LTGRPTTDCKYDHPVYMYLASYGVSDTMLATNSESGRWLMGRERGRRWLDRHGAVDRDVTPLLRARLDARRRGEVVTLVLIVAVSGAYLLVAALSGEPTTVRTSLYHVAVFQSAVALAVIVGLWVQGRNERRVGQALTRRVAHPQAVRVRVVVGRWFVAAAIVAFGAGALAGLVAVMGAGDPEDRGFGLVLLGAVGAFALIGLAGLIQVVRRPAI